MFTAEQLLILKLCAAVIVVGFAVLALDKWWLRPGREAAASAPPALDQQYRMTQVSDPQALDQLRQRLGEFAAVVGEVRALDSVWERHSDGAVLRLVAYQARESNLIATRPGHTVDVPRLAIWLQFAGATLPNWQQDDDAHAPDVLSEPGRLRLQAMDDYRLAMGGQDMLFASQLETLALIQAINVQTSPEFHAGLANSALPIDVQRALDIASFVQVDLPPLPRFYELDLDIQIATPKAEAALTAMRDRQSAIQADMQKAREAMAEKMAADRLENERRRAALRESMKKPNSADPSDRE